MLKDSCVRPLRYLFSRHFAERKMMSLLRPPLCTAVTPVAFSSGAPLSAWGLFQMRSTFHGRGGRTPLSTSPLRAIAHSYSARACIPPEVISPSSSSPSKSPSMQQPLTSMANKISVHSQERQPQQPRQSFSTSTSTNSSNERYPKDEDENVDEEEEDERVKIREIDLEEQFIRGSGPGGQKINKSSVCVVGYFSTQRSIL